MPEISRFHGIVVKMFYNDHAPPHFHAEYGEHELVIGIDPICVLDGAASPRVRSMVLEWAGLHHEELRSNWDRCRAETPLRPIAPLE